MQKVWEATSRALMLIAAVTVGVRFEPWPLSPEQSTFNFDNRTLDSPKLKEFFATDLNPKFVNWPASPGDFSC
jgi:hypothetical protein